MTTKLAGGKITGLLALTMEADYAAEVGDIVEVNGNFTVGLSAGVNPVLGRVSVANKKRVGSTFPSANVPGDVTVEALGLYVDKVQAGVGGITAGAFVKPDGTGRKFVVAAVDDPARCGRALGVAAANAYTDVLFG